MIKIRRDAEIHREEGGWFSARWHFSFGGYRDPEHVGVGPLRVFNDDRLVPGAVWPMHPHKDIEGITYVVEGLFEHADSLGNGGLLTPGAIQRATLGAGMEHSERNGSRDEPMRFLQFWILPDTADLPPSLEQRQFSEADRTDRLLKVLGPEGGEVVAVHQDASAFIARLSAGVSVAHQIGPGRGAYLYLIEGQATLNGVDELSTGDAAVIEEEDIALAASEASELILVEVPLGWTPVGVWAR
ncbi:MAG TPA: pirin family protein [Egibacteraceae bacterium]|nr:pirin family protein [Egibacteraceae bacterium]